MEPVIHPLGLDALLVRFADAMDDGANRAALAFRATLEADRPDGVVETAPMLVSVVVRFDPAATDVEALCRALRDRAPRGPVPADAPPARLWHVPMAVDPEAAATARAAGLSPEALVAAVTGTELRVLTIGFAPGQPYLGLLPPALDLPRAGTLRRVSWGAVVVAVRQLVLFANDSPTGWLPLGLSAFRAFRPGSDEPVPLRPGDGMRVHVAAAAEIAALREAGEDGARLEVRS